MNKLYYTKESYGITYRIDMGMYYLLFDRSKWSLQSNEFQLLENDRMILTYE